MSVDTDGIFVFGIPLHPADDTSEPWRMPWKDGDIDWDNVDDEEDDTEVEFPEWYAFNYRGVLKPTWTSVYPPRAHDREFRKAGSFCFEYDEERFQAHLEMWNVTYGDAWKEYSSARDMYDKRVERIAVEVGCTFVPHCSASCTHWILGATASVHSVSRGDTVEVRFASKILQDEWTQKIYSLCKQIGLPNLEPAYLIASYWGE